MMKDSASEKYRALRLVALSLLTLDPPPEHLVGNKIRLFHICVPTAHHRAARGREKEKRRKLNMFKG